MPARDLVPLEILPGIYSNQTDRGAKGRWKSGNRVRFREGLPETIGGWIKAVATRLVGKCRGIHDWISLSRDKIAGFGTSEKLYLLNSGTLYNITPFRLATDFFGGALTELTNPFTTAAAGSPQVNVAHTSHGLSVGDHVFYKCSSATFDGVTIDGEYVVSAVTSANAFSFNATQNATAGSVNGGGTVDFGYEIAIGQENESSGLGWGAGPWGSGTYGTPRSESTIRLVARIWSIDNWGEDGIFNPRGGAIYLWDFTNGYNARATEIANAPDNCLVMLVSPKDRHMLAFGAHDGTIFDPLLIRWCSQENFTIWTPGATNTAGDLRLDSGSEIVGVVKTREEFLVLTDLAAFSVYFAGPPDIFGLRHLADKCGLIGQKAVIDYGGVVYWMGFDAFWMYDGSLKLLQCDVRTEVFDNINKSQYSLVNAGVNSKFTEVKWLYAVGTDNEVSKYAAYNVIERSWSTGDLDRTAWHDAGPFLGTPYAVGADRYIYQHEVGHDADGAVMPWHLESYDMEIANGSKLIRLQQLVPDFDMIGGTINVYLKFRKHPQGLQITKGPYAVTPTTKFIRPKARGRQMALRLEGNSLGTFMRQGTWRAQTRAHGRK